jgi:hypothetical protein
MPNLSKLSFTTGAQGLMAWNIVNAFLGSPQLRDLRIRGHRVVDSFSVLWSQLTRLGFDFSPIRGDGLRSLQYAINLKVCTINHIIHPIIR